MQRKPKILVVEDETAIRTGLVDVFTFHGFEVVCAEEGNSGLKLSLTGQFDMILLDVMLPNMDGYEICNRIRATDRSQPIIMLTARNTDADIIHGLALGADDYVAKPFSVTQLVLRVQAVLRRSGFDPQADPAMELAPDISIDRLNLSGHIRGSTVAFTRREMDILEYLNQHSGRPVPRDELLQKVWGYGDPMDIETRTVDIHIAKLRRKLEADPKAPQHLLTVRGGGYRLVPQC